MNAGLVERAESMDAASAILKSWSGSFVEWTIFVKHRYIIIKERYDGIQRNQKETGRQVYCVL